jgi:hypothetical protein
MRFCRRRRRQATFNQACDPARHSAIILRDLSRIAVSTETRRLKTRRMVLQVGFGRRHMRRFRRSSATAEAERLACQGLNDASHLQADANLRSVG